MPRERIEGGDVPVRIFMLGRYHEYCRTPTAKKTGTKEDRLEL